MTSRHTANRQASNSFSQATSIVPMTAVSCAWEIIQSGNQGEAMLDLFYVAVAILFFAGCWVFTKACDKL
jgi:hypothetical protein